MAEQQISLLPLYQGWETYSSRHLSNRQGCCKAALAACGGSPKGEKMVFLGSPQAPAESLPPSALPLCFFIPDFATALGATDHVERKGPEMCEQFFGAWLDCI